MDVDKTMEFILDRQAKTEALLGSLAERMDQAEIRMTKAEARMDRFDRRVRVYVRQFLKFQRQTDERFAQVSQKLDEVGDKLNGLIGVVDTLVRRPPEQGPAPSR